MAGRVRTREVCPKCAGEFQSVNHPITRDQIDLICPACRIRPNRYYVDGRGIKDRHGAVGKLYRDRHNNPFDSFLAAKRTLDTIRQEIDEHRFDSTRWSPDRRKELILSKISDPWLDHLDRNLSRGYAIQQRRFLFNHIIPAMGDVDVRDIRGLDVETLQVKLSEKKVSGASGKTLSKNTVRNILTTLRTLLGWLKNKDVILKTPSFPPLSPVPREIVGWIEPETQREILEHVRPDVRLLVETMMASGCRPGEAVAFKVRDLQNGELKIERALTQGRKVKRTKTGAVSSHIIAEGLYARLKEHSRGKLPEAWLFVNAAGRPYHTTQVSWLWRQAAVKAHKEVCLSVASRHSRVSQLRQELERRVSEELRKELAHETSRTTMKHYCRDERELIK
jgi:integrase